MTTLHELAHKARTCLPCTAYKQGGSRLDAAIELVEANQVISLGILPVTGYDYWSVSEYTVSIAGRSCNCPDQSAPLYKGGKLCKHRLAAMLVQRLNESRVGKLEAVLRDAPADAQWLTLRADVYYVDGGGRLYRMCGHHYPGQPWVRYGPDDCYEFDEPMFNAALRRAGWQIDGRPSKQGMAYHYRLVPGGSTETAGVYTLNATAHESLERQEMNRRMSDILERVLERTEAQ